MYLRVASGKTSAPELNLADLPHCGEIKLMPLFFGANEFDFVHNMGKHELKVKSQDAALTQNEQNASQNTDGMHVNVFYGGSLCDYRRVYLSDLVLGAGDTLEWVYDLGEAHRYTIHVFEVLKPDDLHTGDEMGIGGVCRLDGQGNALPCDFGCVEDIALIFNRLWPSAEKHEEVARGRRGETEGGCGCCDAAGAGATPPCFGPLSLAETGGGGGGGGGATPPTPAASASSPADATGTSAVRTLPKQLDRSEYAVAKTGIMPMSPCDWWSMYNDLRRHVQRHNSFLF